MIATPRRTATASSPEAARHAAHRLPALRHRRRRSTPQDDDPRLPALRRAAGAGADEAWTLAEAA